MVITAGPRPIEPRVAEIRPVPIRIEPAALEALDTAELQAGTPGIEWV
jgi:hypothetical protein